MTVAGRGVACSSSIASLTSFTVTGCSGIPTGGAAVTSANESLPGPEANYKVPGTNPNNQITLNWTAVVNAIGYRAYRSDMAGKELLLASVVCPPIYHDRPLPTAPLGDLPT